MISTLTIVRYPKIFFWAGFISMAIFRFSLWQNSKIGFWKLMGSGKNGTFDKTPDLRQWAVLSVSKTMDSTAVEALLKENHHFKILVYFNSPFMLAWWQFWNCEIFTIVLKPIEGHGLWDGREVFGILPRNTDYEGSIAILTRATIRLNKMKQFWSHVDPIAKTMSHSEGFKSSFGIGEIPWIKQATFSLWDSKQNMRNFAYKMQAHSRVIHQTKKGNWYSEEMFVRFIPIESYGTIQGIDPLKRKPYLANNS